MVRAAGPDADAAEASSSTLSCFASNAADFNGVVIPITVSLVLGGER